MNNRWSKIKKIAAYVMRQRNHYLDRLKKTGPTGRDSAYARSLKYKCDDILRYICYLEPDLSTFISAKTSPQDASLSDDSFEKLRFKGHRTLVCIEENKSEPGPLAQQPKLCK